MLVVRNSMESAPKLAIMTSGAVTTIPLSRCDAVATCARCVALQVSKSCSLNRMKFEGFCSFGAEYSLANAFILFFFFTIIASRD